MLGIDAMKEKSQIRVRIAPSPTGDPHVGTAYVALFELCVCQEKWRAVHFTH